MNIKRIIIWGSFIIIIGLIVWGMIVASQKSSREDAKIPLSDKVISTDWVYGSSTAPLTLVEYSDFQCPACAAYFPIVERLLTERGDKIRFVYRHFPLSQHANAMNASQASEAAGKQGKFWEMYRILFEKQKEWEVSTDSKVVFIEYAKTLGLDIIKFTTDFDSKEIRDKILLDQKSGFKSNVQGTPTFYLNGKQINPGDYVQFKKIIDDAISNIPNK